MATAGEDSLREKGLLRKCQPAELQEGLREERAPRSSGNKQREMAPNILGQREGETKEVRGRGESWAGAGGTQ